MTSFQLVWEKNIQFLFPTLAAATLLDSKEPSQLGESVAEAARWGRRAVAAGRLGGLEGIDPIALLALPEATRVQFK